MDHVKLCGKSKIIEMLTVWENTNRNHSPIIINDHRLMSRC
jgi:hypothetical protein